MATLNMAPTRREWTRARAVVMTTTGQMAIETQRRHIPTSLDAGDRSRDVVDQKESWFQIDLFTTEGNIDLL
jgi:hypothetical protein